MLSYNKKMFEEERSIHPEVAPAKVRIQDYKHKGFGNNYYSAIDKVNNAPSYNKKWGSKKKRPVTVEREETKSNGPAVSEHYDATTQASSQMRFE